MKRIITGFILNEVLHVAASAKTIPCVRVPGCSAFVKWPVLLVKILRPQSSHHFRGGRRGGGRRGITPTLRSNIGNKKLRG